MNFPMGEHGYPSIDRDMHSALCVVGAGIRMSRIGVVRSIDIAPSIAEWLRMGAPANARGRPLWRQ